ncbi:MAG: protein kinase [Myxococcota bacterium]|nr:protein kinase [Myxococcota bacterium]
MFCRRSGSRIGTPPIEALDFTRVNEPRKSSNQKFGSYVLLDHIADGGMAEIFLAKRQGYSGFEKFVALKRILPSFNEHAAFREMLIHEAKLAANLQHLNVVQVLDLGAVDDQVYIAMEYIHGRDLASLLARNFRRKECIPLALALSMAIEFLTGIDYAHRLQDESGQPRNLIHRDISPQNILISYEGEVKVTDFGIARAFASDGGIEKLFPGSVQGKFGYMSPEQLRKQAIDQRSDIFSAGVVLHELLTGRRLFWSKNPKDAASKILNQEIPAPSTVNETIPEEIDAVVMKALERDKENRYQTIGSLLGELTKVADNLKVHISRRDIAVYMRRHFGTNSPRPRSTDVQRARSLTLPKISLASSFSATSGLRTPVGDILINRGNLTVSQLDIGLAQQRARGGRIGEILIEQGVISDRTLISALAEQIDLKVCEPGELLRKPPSSLIFEIFPYEAAESMAVLALDLETEKEGLARLVVTDPFDERNLLEAKIILGVNELDISLSTKDEIKEAINHWYHHAGKAEEETLMFNMRLPAQEFENYSKEVTLIVFQNDELQKLLQQEFSNEIMSVVGVDHHKQLVEKITGRRPEIAILDCANGDVDTLKLVEELRRANQNLCLYVLEDIPDINRQVNIINAGANDIFSDDSQFPFIVAKTRRELSRLPSRSSAALITKSHNIGVSGPLSDMTFVDVIQSIELAQKTAVVSFSYEDGRAGEVITSLGKVRSVTMKGPNSSDGNANFHQLAKPGRGRFEILYQDSDAPSNITENNTQLLLEAIRQYTEQSIRADPEQESVIAGLDGSAQVAMSQAPNPYDFPLEEDSTTELRIAGLKAMAQSQQSSVDDSNIFTWSPVISEESQVLKKNQLEEEPQRSDPSFEVDILEPSGDTNTTPPTIDNNDAETEMAFDAARLVNQLGEDGGLDDLPISIDANSLMANPSSSDILFETDPLETIDSQPFDALNPSLSPPSNATEESSVDAAGEIEFGSPDEFRAREERMGPDEPGAPKYNLESEQDIYALPKISNLDKHPAIESSEASPDGQPLPLPVGALTALPDTGEKAKRSDSQQKRGDAQNLARLNLQKVAIKRTSSSAANGIIEEKVRVQHINMSKQELARETWSENSEDSATEADDSEDLLLSIDDIVADDEDLF